MKEEALVVVRDLKLAHLAYLLQVEWNLLRKGHCSTGTSFAR